MDDQPIQFITPQPKKSKKPLFLIIGILALIAIGTTLFFLLRPTSKSNRPINLSLIFDREAPIPVERAGQFSYITPTGRFLFSQNFSSTDRFFGDYARVSIIDGDTTKFQLIDRSANVKFESTRSQDMSYFIDNDVWLINSALYDSKLSRLSTDNISVSHHISAGFFLAIRDNDSTKRIIIDSFGRTIYSCAQLCLASPVSTLPQDPNSYLIISEPTTRNSFVVNLTTGKTIYSIKDSALSISSADNNVISLLNQDNIPSGFMIFFGNDIKFEVGENVSISLRDSVTQIFQIDYGSNHQDHGQDQRHFFYDLSSGKLLSSAPPLDLTTPPLFFAATSFRITRCTDDNNLLSLTSSSSTLLDCNYNQISPLSTNLYRYITSTQNQELIFTTIGSSTSLRNIKSQDTLTELPGNRVTVYANSPFALIQGANNQLTLYNIFTDRSLAIPSSSTIEAGSNFAAVSNNGTKLYYNNDLTNIYTSFFTP